MPKYPATSFESVLDTFLCVCKAGLDRLNHGGIAEKIGNKLSTRWLDAAMCVDDSFDTSARELFLRVDLCLMNLMLRADHVPWVKDAPCIDDFIKTAHFSSTAAASPAPPATTAAAVGPAVAAAATTPAAVAVRLAAPTAFAVAASLAPVRTASTFTATTAATTVADALVPAAATTAASLAPIRGVAAIATSTASAAAAPAACAAAVANAAAAAAGGSAIAATVPIVAVGALTPADTVAAAAAAAAAATAAHPQFLQNPFLSQMPRQADMNFVSNDKWRTLRTEFNGPVLSHAIDRHQDAQLLLGRSFVPSFRGVDVRVREKGYCTRCFRLSSTQTYIAASEAALVLSCEVPTTTRTCSAGDGSSNDSAC